MAHWIPACREKRDTLGTRENAPCPRAAGAARRLSPQEQYDAVLELTGTPPVEGTDSLSFGPWAERSSAAFDTSFKLRDDNGTRTLYRLRANERESVVAPPYGPEASAAQAKLAAVLDALDL